MISKFYAASPRRTARWAAPLALALIANACGADDNSDATVASGAGSSTTGMGGTSAASTTTSTSQSSSATGSTSNTSQASTTGAATTTGAVTTGAVTTGAGGATATGMNASTTAFGGPGAGGSGFGGQSASTTDSTGGMGGTGGTDVAPGETGVFEGTVAAHNQARAEVDVTPPLPELVWSDELAEVAQDWANNLVDETNCGTISHRPNGMYGENIALQGSFGGFASMTGPDAVASWVAEIDCYTYGTIGQTEQCDQACISQLNSSGCGHYTQVVWDSTTAVGCGYGTCEDGSTTIEVIVCNYDPPGNYIGQTPY